MTEIRAFIRHARQVPNAQKPYCTRGWRDYFARKGWAWSEFLASGIPVATLEADGDGPALQLAERARAEHG